MPYICRYEQEEEPGEDIAPEDGDIIDGPDSEIIEEEDAGPVDDVSPEEDIEEGNDTPQDAG